MKLKKLMFLAVVMALTNVCSGQKTMTGIVTDENNEALIGALIIVEGTNIMTLSKTDGSYHIVIPKEYEDNNVVFQYAGFPTKVLVATDGKANVQFEPEVVVKLQEIFVSTQKRLQTSVEVPLAVTAFDHTLLNQLNVAQIDEISSFVPGFNAIIQGQNKVGYSIRGVTSDGMESFFQPRISVFMNGVSVSRMQSAVVESFDMERIEIVRGPQGTLFGRGAEIGAVHYITARPKRDLSANISLNYGGYNQHGVQGFVNTPIGEKLANRFAFCYDYHDGYIKNLDGGRLNGKQTIAIRNSTSLFKNERTSFNFIVDYQGDNTPGVSFKSNKIAPEGGDLSPFTDAYLNGGSSLGVKRHIGGLTFDFDHQINPNVNISNTFGVRASYADEFFDADGTYLPLLTCEEEAESLQFSEEFRLNWTNGSNLNGFVGAGTLYETCEHKIVLGSNLQYVFPILVAPSIQSQLTQLPVQVSQGVSNAIAAYKQQMLENLKGQGYPDAVLQQASDLFDGFNANATQQIQTAMETQVDTWFKGSQWSATPDFVGDTKNIVSGILVNTLQSILDNNQQAAQLLQGQSAAQLLGGMDIGSGLSSLSALSSLEVSDNYEENQTNYTHNLESDIFADVSWNVVGNLYLTLGLRGTYELQRTGYYSSSMVAPVVGTMLYKNSGGETPWVGEDYFSWVGRFIANYMLNKTNNVYLSIAKGRRPGVVYFSSPEVSLKLRPEETYSYELGLKGNMLKNTFQYAASVYYYQWRHFQSSAYYTTEKGNREYRTNDKGRANGKGAEVSLKYHFKRYVTAFGDVTFFDGRFANKDEDGNAQEFAGNRFRLSPDYYCDFGFDVAVPIKDNLMAYFRPNFSYRSKMYFDDSNVEELSQDEYGVVNATLGLNWTTKNLVYDFSLWGKNMTNTQYIIDAGNAGQAIGFPTFVAGAPANFGVKLTVSF